MRNKLALNQGTIKHLPLDKALNVAVQAGYGGFGVWSERIDAFIKQGHSREYTYDLIKKNDLNIVELIYLKEWLFVEDAAKKQSIVDIEDICKTAGKIGAGCICAPAYGYDGNMDVGVRNFSDFCDIAAQYNVKVALEFAPTFKIDGLINAYNIINAANKSNGGLLVDTFHVFKGSTQLDDFKQVPIDKIFLVHLCDCKNLPNIDVIDQARKHRVFPGDGDLPVKKFLSILQNQGYRGDYSLEVLNESLISGDVLKALVTGKDKMVSALNLGE